MAMQHTPLLMSNFLDRGATVAPNEEIVTATDSGVRRQTYRETRDRAHQLAHALSDAGIAIGDRVGTFMWNGSRHLEAYHACAGMGAVLHTLNVRLSEKDLEYIINHAEDKVIIASYIAFTPCQIVGTPADTVTPSLAINSIIRPGSIKRCGMTCLQPNMSADQGMPQPIAWNIGTMPQTVSAPVKPIESVIHCVRVCKY